MVAVAGSVAIDANLVEGVVKQTGRSPRDAAEALIFDAVLAQGASARGLDRRSDVRAAQRAAHARWVTDRITREAAARGAPTDAEVALMTTRHWREVDLPEQARAVHVVVMAEAEPAKRLRARAVAAELRNAVLGARDAVDFIARAKQIDPQGLKITPETLPTFVADGRVVDANGELDKTFATAAFTLAVGETSGIVETPFGLHVIRMLERLPEKHVPLEERRVRFEAEVLVQRAHDAYVALLVDLKHRHPITLDPAADALMANALVQ